MAILPRVALTARALRPVGGERIPNLLPQPALPHPVDEDDPRNPLFFRAPHHAVEVLHLKGEHLVGRCAVPRASEGMEMQVNLHVLVPLPHVGRIGVAVLHVEVLLGLFQDCGIDVALQQLALADLFRGISLGLLGGIGHRQAILGRKAHREPIAVFDQQDRAPIFHGLHHPLTRLVEEAYAIADGKGGAHGHKVNCSVRTLFPWAASCFAMLVCLPLVARAQETLDTNAVPAGFRPYVHLLGSAEVVAPESGPNWRAMDIGDYDEDRKKYQELEEMVLAVWPSVQIITVMLDTLRPTFLSGIEAVPSDTLRAHRQQVQDGKTEAKAERKQERRDKKARKKADVTEKDALTLEIGADSDGPDTLFMPDVDCWIAMQEQDGYARTDSLDSEGNRMLLRDPEFEDEMGLKEGFLLVHLLDRQNPGMLDFADDYAKAIKLPYWRTIKMFSRLTGYRLNRSYDPGGGDGRIEHIIRKHGLDLLDPPCSPQ